MGITCQLVRKVDAQTPAQTYDSESQDAQVVQSFSMPFWVAELCWRKLKNRVDWLCLKFVIPNHNWMQSLSHYHVSLVGFLSRSQGDYFIPFPPLPISLSPSLLILKWCPPLYYAENRSHNIASIREFPHTSTTKFITMPAFTPIFSFSVVWWKKCPSLDQRPLFPSMCAWTPFAFSRIWLLWPSLSNPINGSIFPGPFPSVDRPDLISTIFYSIFLLWMIT